jgi:hypothetical protein
MNKLLVVAAIASFGLVSSPAQAAGLPNHLQDRAIRLG